MRALQIRYSEEYFRLNIATILKTEESKVDKALLSYLLERLLVRSIGIRRENYVACVSIADLYVVLESNLID